MVLPFLTGIGGGLRRTLSDTSPAIDRNPFALSRGYFALLRSYYEATALEDAALWQSYRARFHLPRSARLIYSPARRAVDAYPGLVYPGCWTEDGKPLPDGTPHALQFPSDLIEKNPQLVMAAIQTLSWGNWQAERMTYVREGGITGTVFVEVVDDMDRRKVYPQIVPIERVADMTIDATGNVKAYEIAYRAIDEDGMAYDYRKTVDAERIVEYRDRRVTRTDPNPYGFAPAACVKHRNTGSIFGAPVIAGVIPKIDELNRLATSVHNYIGKLQRQPVVFWSEAAPKPVTKGGATDEAGAGADAENIAWLWGKMSNGQRGYVENMMQAVPIEGAGERIDKLLDEIKADLPEITMDDVISKLPNASGPIIDRMLPSVRGRVSEAQANYDAGTIKIIQMGVAIAGWRVATGAWGPRRDLTRHQLRFDGFDLSSFSRGDLDMSILPRPLVPSTEQERLMALQMRRDVANLSDNEMRRLLGMSDEAITTINQELSQQVETQTVAAF
jgi:hypothetical protein